MKIKKMKTRQKMRKVKTNPLTKTKMKIKTKRIKSMNQKKAQKLKRILIRLVKKIRMSKTKILTMLTILLIKMKLTKRNHHLKIQPKINPKKKKRKKKDILDVEEEIFNVLYKLVKNYFNSVLIFGVILILEIVNISDCFKLLKFCCKKFEYVF